MPLPLPFTEEALALLAPRAAALGSRYAAPFLLENFTYYLPDLPSDDGRDEVAFLNDLTERSGCGLLLDLYNFYCNAVNFRFDPYAALSRLRLDRVIEIHIAGGATHDGFQLDVHSKTTPEPVWELLEWVAPRAPHLAGVVSSWNRRSRLWGWTVFAANWRGRTMFGISIARLMAAENYATS